MAESFEITGLKELNNKLEQLPLKMEKKIVRQGLVQAIRPMRDAAKAESPEETGRLIKAIKIKRLKPHNDIAYGLFIAAGKTRDDEKGAWYGRFVEQGH